MSCNRGLRNNLRAYGWERPRATLLRIGDALCAPPPVLYADSCHASGRGRPRFRERPGVCDEHEIFGGPRRSSCDSAHARHCRRSHICVTRGCQQPADIATARLFPLPSAEPDLGTDGLERIAFAILIGSRGESRSGPQRTDSVTRSGSLAEPDLDVVRRLEIRYEIGLASPSRFRSARASSPVQPLPTRSSRAARVSRIAPSRPTAQLD